ncbi:MULTISPECIES: O-antigen ligase family protein [Nocardioides]|uniref:O-antigen ligase family protein n=1 Tax=Nocardioides vastitatis TaxID=2568655 RepID=A0ABW0ZBN0_9ACTN|nr:O-antigen ligase family protein [Nocardioides sp.]THJ02310.1 O-antigen ligase family protein [Nocardioides sp.]
MPSRGQKRVDPICAVLITLVVARAVVPGAVNYLSATHLSLYVSDVSVQTPAAGTAAAILTILLGLGVVGALARAPRVQPDATGLIVFAGLLALPLLHPSAVGRNQVVELLLTLGVACALWRRGAGRPELAYLGALAAIVAGYALAQGVLFPEHAMFADRFGNFGTSRKAIIGDDQLAGPFGHSNTLGIYCALAVPFALTISRKWVCALSTATLTLAVLWSSSRSALIALGIFFLIVLVTTVTRRSRRSAMRLWGLSVLGLTVVVPFATTDPAAFTRRGAIWMGSIELWREDWVTGLGTDTYERVGALFNSMGPDASSGHNLAVGSLVVSGLAGTVLIYGCLIALNVRYGRDRPHDDGLPAFLAIFGTISIMEYVWVLSAGGELFPAIGLPMMIALVGADWLKGTGTADAGAERLRLKSARSTESRG